MLAAYQRGYEQSRGRSSRRAKLGFAAKIIVASSTFQERGAVSDEVRQRDHSANGREVIGN